MAKREPPRASPKLQSLVKDFQAIASMAGYLTHTMDPPQLRLMFTLYGRVSAETEAEAVAQIPGLQSWCDRLAVDLREGSSSAILPPQVLMAHPQPSPNGQWYLVATLTFTTKVTDASYLRVRTAILKAYKRAILLREHGLAAALKLFDAVDALDLALPEGPVAEEAPGVEVDPEAPGP
jgi:hypothetical protein